MEQLDIFESEGLEPSDVLISHVGFEDDPVAELGRLLDRGANISLDRIGMAIFFEDDHWIRLIEHARERGGIGQLMPEPRRCGVRARVGGSVGRRCLG